MFAVVQLRIMTVVRREMLEMCGLPLDLGGLADDVALVPEIVYVHELVSWYLSGGILVLLGLTASIRAKRRGIYAVSVIIAYPLPYSSHAKLPPVEKRRCSAIRHATLLNQYCRTLELKN